ncbi:calcium/calmodulin-dependent protein kinase type II delta 1 chain-like [Actinia tenebrosa]|uniref:Calcium/calmodulin-dependent protein kinase type II delta 1 chain-like n=1 Tax=Actinia tenebrosa TaxID=6105 RepID=A0A6P8HF35_ACTTE|nr:calcium/calmodulin-dependent protein kinase type II delta 1 chain-like [Actinia tenebrosa]
MLVVDPQQRIQAAEALKHEWICEPDGIPGSRLNRRSTLVRLTAFNARRKLRGVVLGLIARNRLKFKPTTNMKLTRKDSYVPHHDADLQNKVRQLMANDTLMTSIEEEERQEQANKDYNVRDIKPHRSHTYRTSVQLDIQPSKSELRSIRSERRRRSQKRAKENAQSNN